MAGRVLRRAAALGLAAAAAGSLHAVATCRTPVPVSLFDVPLRYELLESARLLQSALLRADPLSGAHLSDVRACAERDLLRVEGEGDKRDPAAATDLRLLLALLAARDGRPDDALQLYAEATRDSPFDRRPRALAYYICLLTDRADGAKWWNSAYRRLVPESAIINPNFPGYYESSEMTVLIDELVVAASLGGLSSLEDSTARIFMGYSALGKLDAELAAAEDMALSMAERLKLQALRVYLHAKMRRLAEEEAAQVFEELRDDRGAGAA